MYLTLEDFFMIATFLVVLIGLILDILNHHNKKR